MINKVYLWTNGIVTAFDEKGEQITKYGGFISEVIGKIFENSTIDTEFIVASWREGEKARLDVRHWFEKEIK